MSCSPSKKGRLKGGRKQSPASLFQAAPCNGGFGERWKHQKTRGKVLCSKLGSSVSATAVSSPSNSSSKGILAKEDLITKALDQQFDTRCSTKSHHDLSEQIVNDVQHILSESVDFVAAKNPHNVLLQEVQKSSIDVSKIHLKHSVKLSSFGIARFAKIRPGMHLDFNAQEKQNDHGKIVQVAVSKNGQSSNGSSTSAPPSSPSKSRPDDTLPEPKQVVFDEANVSLEWLRTSSVGVGLVNVGNTCFLNATLQCLAYTPSLYNYLTTGNHQSNCKLVGFCITCKLAELIPSMTKPGNHQAIRPYQITNNIKAFAKTLSIGRQEDAHEFLRFVIEAIRKSALTGYNVKTMDMYSQETTIASRIFGGFYRSRVLCLACKQPSNVYDPFLDIPLDIGGPKIQSLEDALAAFTRVEQLNSPSNYYKCERCRKMGPATKQVTIHKPPNVLTFQLKRFHYNTSGFSNFSKVDKAVTFPEELDLQKFLSEGSFKDSVKYRLYGVLVHSGGSCHSGHYYSFIKAANNVWHRMDDTSVGATSAQSVFSQKAYLLFYTRIPMQNLAPNRPSSAKLIVPSFPVMNRAQNGQSFGVKLFATSPSNKSTSFHPAKEPQKASAVQTPIGPSRPGKETDENAPKQQNGVKASNCSPLFRPRVIQTSLNTPKVNAQQALKRVETQLKTNQPSSQPSASGAALVPYGSDDEEENANVPVVSARSEPGSRDSSASHDSLKENKALETESDKPVNGTSPVKSFEKLDQATAGNVSDSTKNTTGVLKGTSEKSLMASAPSATETTSATETAKTQAQNDIQSSTVSSSTKRAERKRRKKERKQLIRAEKEKAMAQLETQAVTADYSENGSKKKKKKNRDSTSSDSMPIWVEKEVSEGTTNNLVIYEEPVAEPVKMPSTFVGRHSGKSAFDSPQVLSWDGGKSLLDQEAEAVERDRRKRTFESDDRYDEDFDAGRQKKQKVKNHTELWTRKNAGNPFQRYHSARDEENRGTVRSKSEVSSLVERSDNMDHGTVRRRSGSP